MRKITKLVGVTSKKVIKIKSISPVFISLIKGRHGCDKTFVFETAEGWKGTYTKGEVRIIEIGYTIPEIYEACEVSDD